MNDFGPWRALWLSQLREQPGRLAVTALAVALGVALFSGVYMINTGALNEFGKATRQLVGQADVIIRGPSEGFRESVFVALARDADVKLASPALELAVALPRERESLQVLGVDPLRAVGIQPALLGELAGDFVNLFASDGIFLSVAAAADLKVRPGERFDVIVGQQTKSLQVLGLLSAAAYPQRIGIMDIASAQWTLDRLGIINRIDLRLASAVNVDAIRARIAATLPPGLTALTPAIEQGRAASMSRAYRINLNMLALVSLLTGAFLVFATQALSVLRRRTSLSLLRALGVTRGQLQRGLLAEGLLLGVVGSALGVALGHVFAVGVLAAFRGELGTGTLQIHPLAYVAFFLIGTLVAALGAWVPAREAARRAPAHGLKSGDAETAITELRPAGLGLALLAAGAALAWLPPIGGVAVFGYGSIAALLFGAVLLVPAASAWLLARAPVSGRVPLDVGLAQLRGSVTQIAVSLAAIIVSFSLMVAMAIMVYSFRQSFEVWLSDQLPADVQVRAAQGSDTRFLSEADATQLSSLDGVASIELRRQSEIALTADQPTVALIARDLTPAGRDGVLALVTGGAGDGALDNAWISEAMQDLYGWRLGDRVEVPIGGTRHSISIVGVFRDYGRSTGAIVIPRERYIEITADRTATEAALWLTADANPNGTVAAIRAALPGGESLEVRTTTEIRELSLRAFDRAFLATYALEAVAVLIGLLGVAFAGASTALARRSEFGMLRHVGMLRQQIVTMLAGEGFLISALGVLYGLLLGAAMSLVLIYVVNRQSFSWSIDLAVPWMQLALLSIALLCAATVTNVISGRSALRADALRAVREDW